MLNMVYIIFVPGVEQSTCLPLPLVLLPSELVVKARRAKSTAVAPSFTFIFSNPRDRSGQRGLRDQS
jgi:hypothetical protein